MDIFCLPSYREGLPYTLIEAMLCNLPIITTNIRGCRELIDNEQNGLLVGVKNSEAIYQSIKKYLENIDIANEYSYKAREKALNYHNEKVIIKNHLKILNSI